MLLQENQIAPQTVLEQGRPDAISLWVANQNGSTTNTQHLVFAWPQLDERKESTSPTSFLLEDSSRVASGSAPQGLLMERSIVVGDTCASYESMTWVVQQQSQEGGNDDIRQEPTKWGH
eukprot:573135-Pelagomonas_calceolata.AAC.7